MRSRSLPRGLMDRRGQSYRPFFPAVSLALMSPCYASACSLPHAVTLLSFLFFSCPAANTPPSPSIPLSPQEPPLSLPFIPSQTPVFISSSFPTSWLLAFYTLYQCFNHLWTYFKQPYCTLLQAKTLWAHRAGSKHKIDFSSNKLSKTTE